MNSQESVMLTATSDEWGVPPIRPLRSRDIPKDKLFEFLKLLGINECLNYIERIHIDMDWSNGGLVKTTITRLSPEINESP